MGYQCSRRVKRRCPDVTPPTTHPKPHQTAQHAPISSPLQAQSILAAPFAIGHVYPLLDAVSEADPPMVFKIYPLKLLIGIVLVPTTIFVAPGARLIGVPDTVIAEPPGASV